MAGRTRLTLTLLGWPQLAVVIAGLAAVVAVVVAGFAYDWANLYAEQFGIRKFEAEFGFRWGTLKTDDPLLPSPIWCVVSVIPGGPFDRLGLREGDFPFEHHGGGAYVMQGALAASAAGESGIFDVINIHNPRSSLREIKVPPLKSPAQRSARTESITLPTSQNAPSCWSDPRIATILALGKDHAPDAHAQLKAIADEAQNSEGRDMAKVMLQHWDENDGSYRSVHAQRVGRLILPMEEKQKVLPPVMEQTTLVFDVLVNEQGCSAKVDLRRTGIYTAFADLVLAKVRKLHYVPKKDGKSYVAEKFVLTFTQEVN